MAGTFDTDIITDVGAQDYRDFDGAYAHHHTTIDRRGRATMRLARPPERFAPAVAKALDDKSPFARHAVGPDVRMLLSANRLLPGSGLHQATRVAMGLPRSSAMRDGAVSLTAGQRAMAIAARIQPAPILRRLTALAERFSRTDKNSRPADSDNDG